MIKAILRAISILTGHDEDIKSVSGAVLVNLRRSDSTEITSLGASNVGLLLTREIPFAAAASAKVRLDFGSARVVYAKARVVQTDKTAAAPAGFRFHISVDAQSDAIDNLWLADPSPDDGTQDGQRIALRADDFAEPEWEQDFVDLDGDPSPIRYLSFKPNVALPANTAFRLFVEVKVI